MSFLWGSWVGILIFVLSAHLTWCRARCRRPCGRTCPLWWCSWRGPWPRRCPRPSDCREPETKMNNVRKNTSFCIKDVTFFNEEKRERGYKTKLTTPLTPQCAAQMNSKRLFLLSSHSPFKLRKASFIIILLLWIRRNRQILVGWT